MPPQGDMSMAKALQAEFSKKGSHGKRPIRPGRTRREDPPVAPPRTQKPPAPHSQAPMRAQRPTALPSAWSGPLLTPDDLARIDAVHSGNQTTKPKTLFSYGDISEDHGNYSSHQAAPAAPSFIQQPSAQSSTQHSVQRHASNGPSDNPQQDVYQTAQSLSTPISQAPAQQPLRTQTSNAPTPIQPSIPQLLSARALQQVPDELQQQKRKIAPSSSDAMSVDSDVPLPKLNTLEQELFAKWNPSLVMNFNGSQPKENISTPTTSLAAGQGAPISPLVPAFSQGAAQSSMAPAPSQGLVLTSSTPALDQGSANGVVISGMVSGSGLSKSRWA